MKSHFSFALILSCYITLYTGCCRGSNKNNTHDRTSNTTDRPPNLQDGVQKTGNKQTCTLDEPSLSPQHPTLTQAMRNHYTELCTDSNKNDKHDRTSNTTDRPPNLQDGVQKTGNKQTCTLDEPSLSPQHSTLTQAMRNQVAQAFNASPGTLLTNVEGIDLRQEDLISLQESGWLNDNIIEAYTRMVSKRSKENHLLPKVFVFNTQFFPQLSTKSYEAVKNWTTGHDTFSYDIILVPIHLTNHWCLAVIDFRKKAIEYYDSLGSANPDCLNDLLEYLINARADKKQDPLNRDEWRLECLQAIPKQQNGYDCGVFVCKFADYVARDAPINFTHSDMSYFRTRIAIEILNNKFM